MLFILYGATLEMGFQCRELFKDFGFDIIKKYNFIEDDTKLNKSLYESPEQDSIYDVGITINNTRRPKTRLNSAISDMGLMAYISVSTKSKYSMLFTER